MKDKQGLAIRSFRPPTGMEPCRDQGSAALTLATTRKWHGVSAGKFRVAKDRTGEPVLIWGHPDIPTEPWKSGGLGPRSRVPAKHLAPGTEYSLTRKVAPWLPIYH